MKIVLLFNLGSNLPADLKEFDLSEFVVILGVDLLFKYHDSIHCCNHKVSSRGSKGNQISYLGIMVKKGVKIVLALKMWRIREKGDEFFFFLKRKKE